MRIYRIDMIGKGFRMHIIIKGPAYTVPSSISCTSLLRSEATNRLGVKMAPIKFNIFYQVQFLYLKLLT